MLNIKITVKKMKMVKLFSKHEEVIIVATIQGRFGSNFQITGA